MARHLPAITHYPPPSYTVDGPTSDTQEHPAMILSGAPAAPTLPARDLDTQLAVARPRLARIARARGVPADAVEDVVQHSLLAAWRNLDRLRDPARFDAWLDGICRHQCQRYQRAVGAEPAVPLSALGDEDPSALLPAEDDTPDLDALLDADDRARLLDRALGHLPAATRQAVEACYLADLPSGEAALRLGLSVNALEVRLHRARTQLRQLLNGPLRAEAASLGLLLSGEKSEGWRETREWCVFCGNRRMRGLLDPQPDGGTCLRLRCPECSSTYDTDIECSGGLVALNGLSSFKPAIRRYRAACETYYQGLRASEWRRCPRCCGVARVRAARPGDPESVGERWYAVVECERCEESRAWWPGMAIWSAHDLAQTATRWLNDHPRSRLEPDILTTYAGRPAVRSRLLDVASGRAAVVFTAPDQPRSLAFVEE